MKHSLQHLLSPSSQPHSLSYCRTTMAAGESRDLTGVLDMALKNLECFVLTTPPHVAAMLMSKERDAVVGQLQREEDGVRSHTP